MAIVNTAGVSEQYARTHGQIEYLQLPALDIERSAAFYTKVFGWSVDSGSGSFEAPGLIGQLTTDVAPATGGPMANELQRAADIRASLQSSGSI